jgi:hypothetical protein
MSDAVIFRPGDVVELNDKAKVRSRFPNRIGVVERVSPSSEAVRVRWHGLKRSQFLHKAIFADRE